MKIFFTLTIFFIKKRFDILCDWNFFLFTIKQTKIILENIFFIKNAYDDPPCPRTFSTILPLVLDQKHFRLFLTLVATRIRRQGPCQNWVFDEHLVALASYLVASCDSPTNPVWILSVSVPNTILRGKAVSVQVFRFCWPPRMNFIRCCCCVFFYYFSYSILIKKFL